MLFELQTLIDITETKARFDKSDPKWHQQQNFLTLVQTLGLRVIPYFDESPKTNTETLDKQGFGYIYKGEHRVWCLRFNIEYVDGIDVRVLQNDFDLVPVISGLTETIQLKESVFQTKNKRTCNLLFKRID